MLPVMFLDTLTESDTIMKHNESIGGNEIVNEREDAFSGDTVYTVKNEDGNYKDVDENGNEVDVISLSSPSDSMSDDFVQCDPDGKSIITTSSRDRMIDNANELFAVMPTGELVSALSYGSIMWPHYNDDYINYQQTPLKNTFHGYIFPDSEMTIEAASYYRHSDESECFHTKGRVEEVIVPLSTVKKSDSAIELFTQLLMNGDVSLTVPVFIPSNSQIFTHSSYTDSIADMIVANYYS